VFSKSPKTAASVEQEKGKDPKKTTAKKPWASSYVRIIFPFTIKGYYERRKDYCRCIIDSKIETTFSSYDCMIIMNSIAASTCGRLIDRPGLGRRQHLLSPRRWELQKSKMLIQGQLFRKII
jgi:hypothetical protein